MVLSLACSHQPSSAKPRPEPSAGAGLVASVTQSQNNHATAATVPPFLLQPSLEDVRQALESQDDELAAVALRTKMVGDGPLGSDCHECNYLLGVIEERQGALDRAIAAFENAAQGDWSLKRDALVHLVGLELQRKNSERAEQLLEQVAPADSAETRLSALMAQVDLCQGRWSKGIERLRQLVVATRDSRKRAELQLTLAQALIGWKEVDPVELRSAEEEALHLAEEAISVPAIAGAVLERGKVLLEQLLASRQRLGASEEVSRDRTTLLEALVEGKRWGEAKTLSRELLSETPADTSDRRLYCRILFASGRVNSALAERRDAIDAFDWVKDHCDDADLNARALFLGAGLLSGASNRPTAIARYSELERRFPRHRLADDARLKLALLYRAIGSESRFVELLDSMPDDYPDGDMVLEGLFQLALKNMLQRNWSSASTVLERSERFAAASGAGKDIELDRLRYFLGRAAIENGRTETGLSYLRTLVVERPLTYYMLLAHAALSRTWPSELERAKQAGLTRGSEETAPTASQSAQERSRLVRLSALLGVADLNAADALLDEGVSEKAGDSTVFAVAGMYANAGATKTALTLVKRRGHDWRVRWPTAGWVELWKQAFPRPFRGIVQRQAAKHGVAESLVYAIMREESEFDPKAVSIADAYGLMQLIVPTARIAGRELGISVDARALQKPSVNIALGTSVLARLAERFAGQVALIAAGYNAGPGRPARWLREYPEVDMDLWIELIEFPETRGYVKRVLESQAAYRWLYGSEDAPGATIELLPAKLRTG